MDQITNDLEEIIAVTRRLHQNSKLSEADIIDIIRTEFKKELTIPLSIFSKGIGILETVVKFLKEELNISYSQIAQLINRDPRTIWVCYSKAKQKAPKTHKYSVDELNVPVRIFKNRKLAPMSAISVYLNDLGMRPTAIARMLKRDPRNIWAAIKKVGIKK